MDSILSGIKVSKGKVMVSGVTTHVRVIKQVFSRVTKHMSS